MRLSKEQELEKKIRDVTLSTGNVNRKYVVRDIIFAADRIQTDLFDKNIDPNNLFADVSQKLKTKATSYGADAVINCHFEHEISVIDGQKYLEIFAYGTVVQFTQTTIG